MFPPPPFPLKREPTASAPRGDTLSTRIDKYRPLVISLRFVRQLRNNTAQSLVLFRQARRSLGSPPCGSCSVFEVAHTVNKYASNECSFGCGCPTHNCNAQRAFAFIFRFRLCPQRRLRALQKQFREREYAYPRFCTAHAKHPL